MPATPEGAARFWAKASDGGDTYHPLLAHSADVAAVLLALTEPGSALYDRLVRAATRGTDIDRLRSALVYLAGIHDLGKTNHGFQDKAGPWARPNRRWPAKGHVLPVIASMNTRGPFLDTIRSLVRRLPLQLEEGGSR